MTTHWRAKTGSRQRKTIGILKSCSYVVIIIPVHYLMHGHMYHGNNNKVRYIPKEWQPLKKRKIKNKEANPIFLPSNIFPSNVESRQF